MGHIIDNNSKSLDLDLNLDLELELDSELELELEHQRSLLLRTIKVKLHSEKGIILEIRDNNSLRTSVGGDIRIVGGVTLTVGGFRGLPIVMVNVQLGRPVVPPPAVPLLVLAKTRRV